MATPDKYRHYRYTWSFNRTMHFRTKGCLSFLWNCGFLWGNVGQKSGLLVSFCRFFWIISSIYKSDQEMNISSSCAWYFWRIARGNFNWGQDCDIGAIAICIVYRRNSKIRNCSHTLTGRRLENITIISLQGWSIACWGVDGKYKIL